MNEQVPNTLPIPITLTIEQWSHVMTVLADRPFKEIAQLISGIQQQASQAVNEYQNQSTKSGPQIEISNKNSE